MRSMLEWSVRPGAIKEAVHQFLSTGGQPPAGVKMLGRWHKSDLSGGYALYEFDDPAALYAGAAEWSEVLEFHGHVVIEDAQAAPVLAKQFGNK